ncbi:hypothetical protein NKI89_14625 [Mesorhizobium sp. M0309]|uniref:hypothetical protein n=1 Tax=unclassified Mesorhizobium TaxID=325217 RepID=UPI0003CF5426|nr:hypothetical protein [Mesorhizobium sp. LSHC414A00]ESX71833.1 hypothetical protein X757_22255 [Mesorhizobium sp. LSHC414A00]
MIPLHLDWKKPADGVELEHVPFGQGDADPQLAIKSRSGRFEPKTYRLESLENPIVLHLVNARNDDDFKRFVSRFGTPRTDFGDIAYLRAMEVLRDDLTQDLEFCTDPSLNRIVDSEYLLQRVTLTPSFAYSESTDRYRLVLSVTNLEGLMRMEIAMALEVGATLIHCKHCSKAFLAGPMTRRRTDAVYCSDRCRVEGFKHAKTINQKGSGV